MEKQRPPANAQARLLENQPFFEDFIITSSVGALYLAPLALQPTEECLWMHTKTWTCRGGQTPGKHACAKASKIAIYELGQMQQGFAPCH
jgi:hypothetical protein